MNIIVVGSSISALFFSIYLKKIDNSFDIRIIEKEDRIAKKLYATGNGRCNITNLNDIKECYDSSHESQFFKNYFNSKDIIDYLYNELGIKTTSINGYIYPSSLNSKTFTNHLIFLAKQKGVKFILNTKVIDYKVDDVIEVVTDKDIYYCNKLFFASGGKSSPNLGSDGSVFDILKKHNYEITPLHAGLTPLKIKENLSIIENERLTSKINLYYKNKFIYSEVGEILFKKDRLSGIVSFNVSSIIKRFINNNKDIDIDKFTIGIEIDELTNLNLFKLYEISGINFLNGLFSEKFSYFLLKRSNLNDKNNLSRDDINKLININKEIKFNYVFSDDFNVSQVSVGGVSYSNLIDYTMESNIEKNVYFIGEILNSDGLCGGFNISLCISMSKYAADLLIKEIS